MKTDRNNTTWSISRNICIIYYLVCKISYSTYFQIKGKDLPGAVNVLPAGLGAVLAKRQSSEFKMEVK